MPTYMYDNPSNRDLVVKSFKQEDGSLVDDSLLPHINKIVAEILEIASMSPREKKTLVSRVRENKYEFAVWRAFSSEDRWLDMLVALQAGKVAVRDITLIKQIIDQEFKALLADAKIDQGQDDSKFLIFTGVKNVNTNRGANGLTVRIELL